MRFRLGPRLCLRILNFAPLSQWTEIESSGPGRPNLVLTRNANLQAKGAQLFTDMNEMIGAGYELAGAAGVDEIMLIGGAQLYG